MRSLIVIAALAVLAGCAESPTKTTTTGGPSSGSGKIVTTTPEDSYECDDDLILEPHQPEECIPPEPPEPVVQKPVEPLKPDPIVGTYKLFYLNFLNTVSIWRIFPDGTGTNNRAKTLWEVKDGEYHFSNARGGNTLYVVKLQSLAGEPDLVRRPPEGSRYPYSDSEGIKLSSDPSYSFDFYKLGFRDNQWFCYNLGRGQKTEGYVQYPDHPRYHADSLEECEALCPTVMAFVYNHPQWLKRQSQSQIQQTLASATCPQDRR